MRFQGCNLDCSFCDTKWANKEDIAIRFMTTQELVDEVQHIGVRNVTLTAVSRYFNLELLS